MSSKEGKDWIRDRVEELAAEHPVSVLDIGPGVGTYAKLLSDVRTSRVSAIEIYEPYVHTYRLRDYYDEIVIGDARETELPACDVVILGDVAEHMTAEAALDLWERSATAARRGKSAGCRGCRH